MIRERTAILWLIVALFAIFNVVSSIVPSLVPAGLIAIVNTLLLVGFALLHGGTLYGVKGIAVFALVCLITSNIFENTTVGLHCRLPRIRPLVQLWKVQPLEGER
ncbi:MAG: hypothetical protein M3007_07070 [Candidatus Eremiobacteraeota bacterium]|nr:hypothetical protein [Candidatus Eremiobacteraeota bacterium]